MSPKLEIRVLGTFHVLGEGQPVTQFESETARALLAYLATHQEYSLPREVVAELLWPDRPAGAALKNLRHTLSTLRRSLNDLADQRPIVKADRRHLSLAGPPQVTVDAQTINRLARMSGSRTPHVAALEAAIELYRGPLLEDLVLRDRPEWDQWLVEAREHYHRSTVVLVHRLVTAYEQLGEIAAGLAAAQRLVELDPWNERGHRTLMRLLVHAGEPTAALAHFADLRKRLNRQLQTEPTPMTVELANQVRAGALHCTLELRTTHGDSVQARPLLNTDG